MACEFWFYSQLHRLGYEAYITLGNTKSIDITVILRDEKGDKKLLTFDVKGKQSFNSGTYQYLPEIKKNNHFFVFVGLQTKKDKDKIILIEEPKCFIIKSSALDKIASKWESSSKRTQGYGFNPRILEYLKSGGKTKIAKGTLKRFKADHRISSVNFNKYRNIIMNITDFEDKYYEKK